MTHAAEIADAKAAAILAARGILPDPTITTGNPYWGYSWRWDDYACMSVDEMLLNVDDAAYARVYIAEYERDLAAEQGDDDDDIPADVYALDPCRERGTGRRRLGEDLDVCPDGDEVPF